MSSSFEAGHDVWELFLSVTDHCNLACTYCSADAGPDRHNRLPAKVAEDRVRQWIEGARPGSLSLVFTGGEPTLWGYDNLDRTCQVATEQAELHRKVLRIGVQSNGTVLGPRFVEWCLSWNVMPSFSLDGLPELSDRQRGRGGDVIRNLNRLRDVGLEFGVIVCLTRDVAINIDAVLDWYRRNRILKVRMNTLGTTPISPDGIHPSADELHYARRQIYHHMQVHGEAGVQERNVAEMVALFDGAMGTSKSIVKRHCAEVECGAGKHIAAVNPDGAWVPCVEKSMTDGLPRVANPSQLAPRMDELWQGLKGWDVCRACRADPICDHGCPVYHKLDHEGFAIECDANRLFWDFLAEERSLTPSQPAELTADPQ